MTSTQPECYIFVREEPVSSYHPCNSLCKVQKTYVTIATVLTSAGCCVLATRFRLSLAKPGANMTANLVKTDYDLNIVHLV